MTGTGPPPPPTTDWEAVLAAASEAQLGRVSASARVLVAGVGNIFFGDDGFGVEVARALEHVELDPAVRVADFGIRGVHLAYELLGDYEAVVIVDAVAHGDPPGTISVIEPELEADQGDGVLEAMDAHGMDPAAVLAMVEDLGGHLGQVYVIACEAASAEEGIGLSEPVRAAVPLALEVVQQQLASILGAAEQEVGACSDA